MNSKFIKKFPVGCFPRDSHHSYWRTYLPNTEPDNCSAFFHLRGYPGLISRGCTSAISSQGKLSRCAGEGYTLIETTCTTSLRIFFLEKLPLILCLYVCVCTCLQQHRCRGQRELSSTQRTTSNNQFSPSTIWVQGTGPSGLAASILPPAKPSLLGLNQGDILKGILHTQPTVEAQGPSNMAAVRETHHAGLLFQKVLTQLPGRIQGYP